MQGMYNIRVIALPSQASEDGPSKLAEEVGQEVQRKPDDGKVISVDTRDKGRTEALYGVRSRLVHGFSAFDIASDLFPSQWPHGHFRSRMADQRPPIWDPPDTQSGIYFVGSSLKHRQHVLGMRFRCRFAQDLSVEDDDSICANDDGITLRCLILRCDCGRFTAGQSLDESRRRDLFCNVFIRVADLGPKG